MSCANVPILGAVEGAVDAAVLERIVRYLGHTPGSIIDCGGKPAIRERLRAFNHSAKKLPWLVLADLDNDADCAPHLRSVWLPSPSKCMCLRFAVREIESWLLADRERFSAMFHVPPRYVPANPEALTDAKAELIRVIRHSKSSAIRHDMVPRPSSGRDVGPAYTSRLIEYVVGSEKGWRPDVAATVSPSLASTIHGVQRLSRH